MLELMLDTVNLDELREGIDAFPIVGVTSNPSIVKREGNIDFWKRMKEVRDIIGHRMLHVQVISTDCEGILAEAERILSVLGHDTYVKIPVSTEGLKAIKILSKRGVNVTATAIYSTFQGIMAILAGAKYVAVYYSRMLNIGVKAAEVVNDLAGFIDKNGYNCKILAASFHDVSQLTDSFSHGAHSATVPLSILRKGMSLASIQEAVTDFNHDWEEIHGEGTTLLDV